MEPLSMLVQFLIWAWAAEQVIASAVAAMSGRRDDAAVTLNGRMTLSLAPGNWLLQKTD
jgi:hypothetical protein